MKYSIIVRLSAAMITFYIIMLAICMANNLYAISAMRSRVHTELYDSLYQENKRIAQDLNTASMYLSTFSLDGSYLPVISAYKQDADYYSTLYKVKSDLANALSSLPSIQCLFLFPTTSQQFIYAYSSGNLKAVYQFREVFRTACENDTLDEFINRYWYPYEIDGHAYLLRIFPIGDSYVGAWTDFSTLLSGIKDISTLDVSPYYYFDNSIAYDAISQSIPFSQVDVQYKGSSIKVNGRSFLCIQQDTSYTQGHICLLVSNEQITGELTSHYYISAGSAAFILFLGLLLLLIFRNYLRTPLARLEESLVSLQKGDFSTRVSENDECMEFARVNHSFNIMVKKIEDLKIGIYEEKLNQQKTELQSLKNQIAPHFLINCLNAMYHMAAGQNLTGIQNMSVRLGKHLRYALADASVVPLNQEVEMVENYVELSKIRFPESIDLYLDMPHSCQDALIPPMILLFQVENIIKYEVINGKITEIHIEISGCRKENRDVIHICIWDNGNGYNDNVLNQLSTLNMLNQSDGHNIGTRNIYQRLHLLFDHFFEMRFQNRENAGAQVDILIPYQTI